MLIADDNKTTSGRVIPTKVFLLVFIFAKLLERIGVRLNVWRVPPSRV
jgi:hypothetical protein